MHATTFTKSLVFLCLVVQCRSFKEAISEESAKNNKIKSDTPLLSNWKRTQESGLKLERAEVNHGKCYAYGTNVRPHHDDAAANPVIELDVYCSTPWQVGCKTLVDSTGEPIGTDYHCYDAESSRQFGNVRDGCVCAGRKCVCYCVGAVGCNGRESVRQMWRRSSVGSIGASAEAPEPVDSLAGVPTVIGRCFDYNRRSIVANAVLTVECVEPWSPRCKTTVSREGLLLKSEPHCYNAEVHDFLAGHVDHGCDCAADGGCECDCVGDLCNAVAAVYDQWYRHRIVQCYVKDTTDHGALHKYVCPRGTQMCRTSFVRQTRPADDVATLELMKPSEEPCFSGAEDHVAYPCQCDAEECECYCPGSLCNTPETIAAWIRSLPSGRVELRLDEGRNSAPANYTTYKTPLLKEERKYVTAKAYHGLLERLDVFALFIVISVGLAVVVVLLASRLCFKQKYNKLSDSSTLSPKVHHFFNHTYSLKTDAEYIRD